MPRKPKTKKALPADHPLNLANLKPFLPEGYKAPSIPGYKKLTQGTHRFRIMPALNGTPHMINGVLTWYEDLEKDDVTGKIEKVKRPCRVPVGAKTPEAVQATADGRPKVFHCFFGWFPDEEQVHILEITQTTIWGEMIKLIGDKDWGDPFGYDILITRDDAKKPNMYSITPKPKSDIPKAALKAMQALGDIDLRELYRAGDPFSPDRESPVEDDVEGL